MASVRDKQRNTNTGALRRTGERHDGVVARACQIWAAGGGTRGGQTAAGEACLALASTRARRERGRPQRPRSGSHIPTMGPRLRSVNASLEAKFWQERTPMSVRYSDAAWRHASCPPASSSPLRILISSAPATYPRTLTRTRFFPRDGSLGTLGLYYLQLYHHSRRRPLPLLRYPCILSLAHPQHPTWLHSLAVDGARSALHWMQRCWTRRRGPTRMRSASRSKAART